MIKDMASIWLDNNEAMKYRTQLEEQLTEKALELDHLKEQNRNLDAKSWSTIVQFNSRRSQLQQKCHELSAKLCKQESDCVLQLKHKDTEIHRLQQQLLQLQQSPSVIAPHRLQEYDELTLQRALETTRKFAYSLPTSDAEEYWKEVMPYCTWEMHEQLEPHCLDENLYQHKIAAYMKAFPDFVYVPPVIDSSNLSASLDDEIGPSNKTPNPPPINPD
ncbi:unnamed protein product [Sphagnum balticum]